MKTSITNKDATCLNCNSVLDAASSMKNHTPSEGDISVCAYCYTVSKFTKDLNLIPLSKDELADLKANHRMTWEAIIQIKRLLQF